MDLTKKGVKPMGQEEICAVFARNLNKLMVRENLKQSDLVLKLSVSKAQVSDWCAGKNIPRSNYLAALVLVCIGIFLVNRAPQTQETKA